MRLGFWIDPLSSLQVGHDTTFALMLEAQARGHEVWVFEADDVAVGPDGSFVRGRKLKLRNDPKHRADELARQNLRVAELDAVFLRKDPPADVAYEHVTRLLELIGRGRAPLFVNAPSALRDCNEKLYALRFPDLSPRTLVSASLEELRAFREVQGDVVVKPLDGFAGRGIFLIKRDDPNAAAILETSTELGHRPVVMQEFLPLAKEGDKRILLLGGEPIGAILRVGSGFRNNLATGGRAERTMLDAADRRICDALSKDLVARGLHFVGIDVIGGKLTEVNVTSPTGLVEANHADHLHLETKVLQYVERRAS